MSLSSFHPASSLSPEQFTSSDTFYALSVPARKTGEILKLHKAELLNRPKVRNVVTDESDKSRRLLILKNPCPSATLSSTDLSPPTNLSPQLLALLSESASDVKLSTSSVVTTYADLTVDQVLRAVIPPSVTSEIPSSFETVGHIAHVNLRPAMLPWKYVVGKAVMDKNKHITKVVNKVGQISEVFRTFPMEVIAGPDDGDYTTTVKEGGVRFEMDFGRVYWNSKLQYEHRRVVDRIAGMEHGGAHKKSTSGGGKKGGGGRVADVMAGIGPFAVPLAVKHGVEVWANDLNPSSYQYLKKNIQINKCGSNVKPFNLDGREFIHYLSDQGVAVDHVVMNLPAIAVEFLDAFRGWKVPGCRPRVHVHCFVKGAEEGTEEKAAIARCERALGCGLDMKEDEVDVHWVRDVAPKKPMLCVSFLLPSGVEGGERVRSEDYVDGIRKGEGGEPAAKKAKVV